MNRLFCCLIPNKTDRFGDGEWRSLRVTIWEFLVCLDIHHTKKVSSDSMLRKFLEGCTRWLVIQDSSHVLYNTLCRDDWSVSADALRLNWASWKTNSHRRRKRSTYVRAFALHAFQMILGRSLRFSDEGKGL